MFRVSDLLQTTRLGKDLTLEEISKKLKIPMKYLAAIEQEDQKNFPREPYCSLIVKDYSHFLGLDGQQTVRLFHRDLAPPKTKVKKKLPLFSFTPQFTITLITIISLLAFSSYLVLEYFKFNSPPKLKVDWPQTVRSPLLIQGLTNPDASVRINDSLVIVQPNGNFDKKVNLAPGQNQITVSATSPAGKSVQDQHTYLFEN